jgi:hypothetical protein
MQDRPTATELLTTISGVLEGDVMPLLEDPIKHRVRVAANLCQILAREWELGPAHDVRERELLSSLLGAPPGTDNLALNQTLVDRLNAEHDPALERGAWPALVEIVRGKLAIAKPGHDSYDFAAEAE